MVNICRQYLANLTQGLYILNDEFHRENMIRYQDVHQLVLHLNTAKNDISNLQVAMNTLLSQNATAAHIVGSTGTGSVSCRGMPH
jgi:hypothetical protein